ncbi:MAG TPA: BlaI/MecI/CopY family transcriptional regulator [Candidatus Tumulicola sp.]|jgi:predicted transcriptional regulator
MPRKKSPVLTDHELRLMEVLWRENNATVADVVAALAPPALTYSTVLTTLRTLEQKGYVAHEEDGRAFVYHPVVEQRQAANSAMRYLLDRFFGNSPGALAVALLDDGRLSDEELARIQRSAAKRRKKSR